MATLISAQAWSGDDWPMRAAVTFEREHEMSLVYKCQRYGFGAKP
jgi:hypothetical protein